MTANDLSQQDLTHLTPDEWANFDLDTWFLEVAHAALKPMAKYALPNRIPQEEMINTLYMLAMPRLTNARDRNLDCPPEERAALLVGTLNRTAAESGAEYIRYMYLGHVFYNSGGKEEVVWMYNSLTDDRGHNMTCNPTWIMAAKDYEPSYQDAARHPEVLMSAPMENDPGVTHEAASPKPFEVGELCHMFTKQEEDEFQDNRHRQMMERARPNLSSQQFRIMQMRVNENMAPYDIAAKLGSTVHHIYKQLKALRVQLYENVPEDWRDSVRDLV